jgi:hypothetical protein
VFALGVHGVAGDHDAGQVGDGCRCFVKTGSGSLSVLGQPSVTGTAIMNGRD